MIHLPKIKNKYSSEVNLAKTSELLLYNINMMLSQRSFLLSEIKLHDLIVDSVVRL